MRTLVDTSIWIDYFKDGSELSDLDKLIDENLIVTNSLILTELIPFLKIRNQVKLIKLMKSIEQTPLDIDWEDLTALQTECLRFGHNGIGIPDLIIAQNALQNDCRIFSHDKHFQLLSDVIGIELHT